MAACRLLSALWSSHIVVVVEAHSFEAVLLILAVLGLRRGLHARQAYLAVATGRSPTASMGAVTKPTNCDRSSNRFRGCVIGRGCVLGLQILLTTVWVLSSVTLENKGPPWGSSCWYVNFGDPSSEQPIQEQAHFLRCACTMPEGVTCRSTSDVPIHIVLLCLLGFLLRQI